MQVITLAKVKELLGLAVTTYDTAITSAIPYIDSAVKRITRNKFNLQIVGNTTDGSDLIEVYSICNYAGVERTNPEGINAPGAIDDIYEYIDVGMLIEGDNIPADSYITEIYDPAGRTITIDSVDYTSAIVQISDDATETESSALIYLGIPIAYQSIIAKAVWWQTQQASTTLPSFGETSRSFGPLSCGKSDNDAQIDGKYGVPAWFVKALPHYMGGH